MTRYRILWAAVLTVGAWARGRAAEEVEPGYRAVLEQLKTLSEKVDAQEKKLEAQDQTIQDQNRKLKEQDNLLSVYKPGGGKIAAGPAGDVLARLQKVEQQSADALKAATRKKPGDLNMAVGASLNTSFRSFDGPNSKAERPAGQDFNMRGAELVFSADVDTFFKTYMVLNGAADAASNDEAVPTVEEAAIYTTSLSHVSVKGGRFFVPFGRLSAFHDDALPFVTRPRVLDTYVGGESAGDGVQVQALIPIKHFFLVTGGIFNKVGAEFPLLHPLDGTDATNSRRNGAELTYALKMLTSFDIGDTHTFELGASTIQVPDQAMRRNLTNIEFTYKWHPTGSPLREKLVWGTELLRNEVHNTFLRDFNVDTDGDGAPDTVATRQNRRWNTGYGGYSYVEYFLSRHWSLGASADLFQPTDPTSSRANTRHTYDQTYSLFTTYKFTEFSLIRFQGSRHEYHDGHSANEFFLQWMVFWGAHTHNFDMR
ncbi:MAG: hypothetical protein HY291_14815 [Planctomycetes bacterium]|nr:hypothetical protein [Planctomycetota bacterium]